MTLAEIIQLISLITAGSFALYQYYKQNKFERLKILNDLWRKFYETDEFVYLFDLLDRVDNYNSAKEIEELKSLSTSQKLKYLAFLEEVAWYMEFSSEDKKKLIYLFQWHFYYLFQNEKTYFSFWANLSEIDNEQEIKKIINAPYWKKMRLFSLECAAELKKGGSI